MNGHVEGAISQFDNVRIYFDTQLITISFHWTMKVDNLSPNETGLKIADWLFLKKTKQIIEQNYLFSKQIEQLFLF